MLPVAMLGMSLALIDPLVKVFPGDQPVSTGFVAEAARGEVASWQVVLRADHPLSKIKLTVGGLNHGRDTLGRPRIRAIGMVPVDKSIPEPPKERIGTVPGLYPDPLLPDGPKNLEAGQLQSYWIDLPIPKSAVPGEYRAQLEVKADGQTDSVTLNAKVYDVTVGKSSLWMTNWYSPPPGDPRTDPKFWHDLALYAKNMAAHRQNMALVSPLGTVDLKGDGGFDFSIFNRWVETFARAGVIGRIEGGHVGGRVGGAWEAQFDINVIEMQDGKPVTKPVDPSSPEAAAFYSKFLPALVKDLKDHRWLDIYSQHIADEPIQSNIKTYVAMRDLIRKYAPELKIMEATHTAKLEGSIDVWVPQFNYWAESYPFYQGQQTKGKEVWYYTCVYPQGEYANRFMEQPLVETRLLSWIAYRYGATGYLHWGWNHWGMVKPSPFETTTYQQPGGSFLPAGDCFIVYPAKDGGVLDSIRWETMRDGVADYELLEMLATKDRAKAQELAARLVKGFTSYDLDLEDFRAVRHELLAALAG